MKLARFFGIPLYLHWSWLLVLGCLFLIEGMTYALFFTIAFVFVVFHEYGHCLMARYLGVEVIDVTLYPIGGIARIPSFTGAGSWTHEFMIALAGPLVNLFLLLVFSVVGLFVMGVNSVLDEIIFWGAYLNVALAVFNLLPIFPMDGGRVFRSLLYGLLGSFEKATVIAVRVGQVAAGVLAILALVQGRFFMAAIFVFIAVGAQAELLQMRRQMALDRVTKHLMTLTEDGRMLEDLPQVIAALEEITDETMRSQMMLDELLPILKDHLFEQKKQAS